MPIDPDVQEELDNINSSIISLNGSVTTLTNNLNTLTENFNELLERYNALENALVYTPGETAPSWTDASGNSLYDTNGNFIYTSPTIYLDMTVDANTL